MYRFTSENFLLGNDRAKELYNTVAKDLPIIDYHTRMSSKDIYDNIYFDNVAQITMKSDHAAWRLMRANGVEERYVSGDASDKEKFFAFAKTMGFALGNPLHHIYHLMLSKFFGIDLLLNEDNAQEIWDTANAQLGPDGLRARDIIKLLNVKVLSCNAEPFASLRYYRLLHEQNNDFSVVPTFKIDNLINIEFESLQKDILQFTGKHIETLYDYEKKIRDRIEYFHQRGCRSLDFAETEVFFEPIGTDVVDTFQKIVNYMEVSPKELLDFKTYITHEIIARATEKDWVFKMHYGVLMNINEYKTRLLGKNTGFNGFSESVHTRNKGLYFMFNQLQNRQLLTKIILYNLNPSRDIFALVTSGSFQEARHGVHGLIQAGSAWWYQNNISGHKRQLTNLAEQSVLGDFIGMNSDTRNLFLLILHDYFRRILCDTLGSWMEEGILPDCPKTIGNLVENICYKNAVNYFNFDLKDLDIPM